MSEVKVKVHELAKELDISSKDLVEKIKSMGYDVTNHMSSLSEIDAKAVRNTILYSQKKAETKIVKVAPKESEKKSAAEEEVRVVKQAAVVARQTREQSGGKPGEGGRTKPAAGAVAAKAGAKTPEWAAAPPQTGIRPPEGVPMPKRATAAGATEEAVPAKTGVRPPEGVPMPKRAAAPTTEETAPARTGVKPPEGVPMPKAAGTGVKPPEGVPMPKRAAAPAAPEEATPVKEDVKPPEEAKAPIKEEKTEAAPAVTADVKKEAPAAAEKPAKAEDTAPAEKKPEGVKAAEKPAPAKAREERPQAAPERKPEQTKREDVRPQRPASGERPAQGDRPPRPDNRRPAETAGGQTRPQPPRRPKSEVIAPIAGGESKGRKADKAPDKKGKYVDKGEKDRRDGKGRYPTDGKRPMTKPAAPKKPHKTKAERIAEREAANQSRINMEELPEGSKVVNVPITVAGLAEQIDRTSSEIIMALMKMGIMANINQNIDEETAILLGVELGLNIVVDRVEEAAVEEGLETFKDEEADLKARPPIITVMGHVDHGKTSLLDAIRKTNITAGEAGGITQHIGASEVTINGQKIVFLDTPGHEAFTAMRARGAHITDIAVLVVAADDSVKPQTVESISHAKAAGVPVIVAINKMDKPGANPEKVKQDLTEHGILVEEWGGDVICVPVSAKSGEGIVNLLEMILLQAEVLELKANPNRMAIGSVIEAKLDKARGPVATLLVLNGTLKPGMSIVAGTCSGKVRAMNNSKGEAIRKAGPATAVEILGLTDVPQAGDEFNAVKEAADAKEIAEHRRIKQREEVLAKNASITLEQLFSQIQEGEVKELNLIVKADVQGSVGALIQSLEKLHNENVKVKIIHSGVGTITESDVTLANTAGAIIIGFNVRPSSMVTVMAEEKDVEIRTYRVIYEIIDDIEAAMKGMLDPIFKEVIMGKVEIRNTFKVPGVGIIGGAYVTEGKVQRNAEIRLVRDGIVIHEGKISSLKRFKDDAKEVLTGFECGIGIEKYNDIKEGDIIEAFQMEEVERK